MDGSSGRKPGRTQLNSTITCRNFPGGPVVKNLPYNAKDMSSNPGSGLEPNP